MRRMWSTKQTCQYARVNGDTVPPCPNLARYLILFPPLAFRPTPSSVWLDGENPASQTVQQRPAPQYCRVHAYLLCGLDPGMPGGTRPSQGRTFPEGPDDAALL